jgi:V/A-type H+-transporting ATPase subunit A
MSGKIYRVSGPVVIARGLESPNMYDVVKVGNSGLIGEIIKLQGADTIIQVYEDTTGLKPGEPVESTGTQLSVVLGPGLIGSIYDGIQRPLDKIKEVSGDFITRGINVDSLDQRKKWHFVPLAGIKKGSVVKEGQVIGEVQETDLIKHRIMVPIGVKGAVESIEEGDYTVNGTVAKVKTEKGSIEVKLAQRWPVRVPRPTLSKLAPEIPLITGQRVVDTFFPVAKGGTAAVPGPFGSGKCVTGDTEVLLGNGNIKTIEELFNENKYSPGSIIKFENDEQIIFLNKPIGIYSFMDERIVKSETDTLYKGKSSRIVEIKTRTGRIVKVTPIHKLFKVADGKIEETEAAALKPGDYIAAARKYDVEQKDMEIKADMLPKDLRVADAGLARGGESDKPLHIPEKISRELGEFFGLYTAGGCIRDTNTVVFTNSDASQLGRFAYLSACIFGLEPKYEKTQEGQRKPNMKIYNADLAKFLSVFRFECAAQERAIPEAVIGSSNEVLGAFLSGYFAGSGSFYNKEVRLSTASKRLATQLVYALSRFGILSSISKRNVKGSAYYSVSIRSKEDLALFYNVISKSIETEKVRKLRDYVIDQSEYDEESQALNGSDSINNCIGGSGRSVQSAGRYIELVSMNSGSMQTIMQEQSVARLGESLDYNYIFCDQIKEIRILEGEFDVYDVSVPKYGMNFVGGNGGVILHNTVIQHQLAKWSDAEVVIFVGCGERGNEMTEVLSTFPELKDPKTGRPLMERTVLIANTSNMPVAAREASIYTGITIAEYYRDMGYSVALMADSTSRWAEALREISGRLEEMPGEEGYPAYLGRKVAEFYERAGRVNTLGGAVGSVTAIGAVSPPGGDISEPVSQNTLRVTRVFWALDAALANSRHFPSINWLTSYSLYIDDLSGWYEKNVNKEWGELYSEAMKTLQMEAEINEIVQLVGYDALPESNKATLDIAKSIREDYLQQSAFDEVDTFTSMKKQYYMLKAIITMGRKEYDAVKRGIMMDELAGIEVKQRIAKMKFVKEEQIDAYFDDVMKMLDSIDKMEAKLK